MLIANNKTANLNYKSMIDVYKTDNRDRYVRQRG